jgi:hypothetical protein
MATKDEWIADGTLDTAPVTAATPAVEATPAATPAVAPEATPAAAAAPATPAAAPAVPAAPPAPTVVQEFIEAQLDGKPFQLPKGVMLPLKRGDTIEYEPVDVVQSRGMLERDYRIKTGQVAEERRQLALEAAKLSARMKALEGFKSDQLTRLNTIPTTPEEQAKAIALAELSKNDPFFQKLFEDAEQGRVLSAEREVEEQQVEAERQVAIVNLIENDIARFSTQYGVDAARLRDRYSAELTAGHAELHPSALEALARQEAQYRQSVADSAVAPIQSKLDELLARVSAFEAAQAAADHNASTKQAIARAANPVGAPPPAVGAPVPTSAASKISGATMMERSNSWAAQR